MSRKFTLDDFKTPEDIDRALDAITKVAATDELLYADLMLAGEGELVRRHKVHELFQYAMTCCIAAHKHLVIVSPPEHGKSSQIAKRLIHEVGKDLSTRVGLVSADSDLSARNLVVIRKGIVSALNQRVFPDMKPDTKKSMAKGEWSKEKLYLDGQEWPAFEKFPLDGNAEGVRLDLIWLDDAVTRKCARYEADRVKAHSAIHGTWLNRLTDRGIAIITNNVWHRDDPIHKMLDSESFCVLWIGYEGVDRMYWRVHHPPSNWEWDSEGCYDLWEQWPRERLESRREADPPTYRRLFGGVATAAEDSKFIHSSQWARYHELPKPGNQRLYAAMDPSGGKGSKREDYCSIWVLMAKWDRTLLVIDGYVGRCTPEEQIGRLFGFHRKWLELGYGGISSARVEVLKKDELWVLQPFKHEQERLRLASDPAWQLNWNPHHPFENKESRILRVAPWLAKGWAMFPHDLDQRIRSGSDEFSVALRLLSEQLEDFPFGGHDDAPDGFEQAIDCATAGGVDKPVFGEALQEQLTAQALEDEWNNRIRFPGIDGMGDDDDTYLENPWGV